MAEDRVQRRLAAILAADVIGYSRLMEADEAGTLAHLKALRRDVFEPKTKQYGGRIFKTTGDGALVEFKSAVDAVSSAVDIQSALVERDEGLAEKRRIRLRIGVSLGDVIVEGSDLYGSGVNVAARMEGLADPGGICISANVHEHVRSVAGFAFDDLGEQQVKNIDRSVHAWRVRLDGRADEASVAAPREAVRADRPSVAVLPFANMSGDPEHDYFADGMVEEIVTGLARIRWLTVIARNSTFAYKSAAPDVRKVGQELNVRYILEGSVRKSGDRVRIAGQLIEAETGGHLWADRFDGTLADVFDLQDRITAAVVAAIEPSVRRAEIVRAKRKRPDNLDAYDLYLRALEQNYTFTQNWRSRAIELLDRAVTLDPGYAEAHGFAAYCLMQRYLWEGRSPEDRAAALDHATAVAAAWTDDASTLAFAAFAMFALSDTHEEALAMVERALAHNPSSAIAHTVYAALNSRRGRYDRCRAHAERALRLSPFDPMRYISELNIACSLIACGDYEGALAGLRRSLAVNAAFVPARIFETACLVRLGRREEAMINLMRILEGVSGLRVATFREFNFNVDDDLINAIIDDLRAIGLPE